MIVGTGGILWAPPFGQGSEAAGVWREHPKRKDWEVSVREERKKSGDAVERGQNGKVEGPQTLSNFQRPEIGLFQVCALRCHVAPGLRAPPSVRNSLSCRVQPHGDLEQMGKNGFTETLLSHFLLPPPTLISIISQQTVTAQPAARQGWSKQGKRGPLFSEVLGRVGGAWSAPAPESLLVQRPLLSSHRKGSPQLILIHVRSRRPQVQCQLCSKFTLLVPASLPLWRGVVPHDDL